MDLPDNNRFNSSFFCPVCESDVQSFLPFGLKQRQNALCPNCSSLERHRVAWLFFLRFTNLFTKPLKKFLHIAPETCLSERFICNDKIEYFPTSFSPRKGMISMDIRKINLPNESFDVIYCSHVLEHIVEDNIAILELNRILDKKGWAVFQVPIFNHPTYEDFSIKSPNERELAFGQHDHVRKYGIDFKNRLENGGFYVRHFKTVEIVKQDEALKMGLKIGLYAGGADIFLCIKDID
jgi:SAM-dependent methyltransferase